MENIKTLQDRLKKIRNNNSNVTKEKNLGTTDRPKLVDLMYELAIYRKRHAIIDEAKKILREASLELIKIQNESKKVLADVNDRLTKLGSSDLSDKEKLELAEDSIKEYSYI